ncbi:MAG: hypothetical protein JWO33_1639, partial [Caulobacteraceae bacterium]|nr:hypothetical protein [Caulobacteraceae bacterium]
MGLVPLLPTSGLVRVIYASRWGACVSEDLHHVVRHIVSRSMQNNRLVDVTGLLLVHAGWFMQVLEGPAESVRETFARIAADGRHFDVTVLASGSADQRLFRDWNMCERRLSPGEYRLLDAIGMGEKFAPAQLDA